MPAYHSGNLSKTDRPYFNYPLRPNAPDLTQPHAPRNLMVTNPYSTSMSDIRWDNPKILPFNSGLNLLGCNVYRSTDSPYGPYIKCNLNPITVLFYRDETQEEIVHNENATPTIKHILEPELDSERWLVYAQHKPMVIPGTNGKTTQRIEDVKVEIDNGDGLFKEVPAFKVSGDLGEIQLISTPVYNYQLQQIVPPRLPVAPNGRVRISYTYLKNQVLTVLSQRIYYKVTTVAVDPNDASKTIETPLEEVSERSTFDIEIIDYIWREAILRNRYILEQGGERVKIFIRKWMGSRCPSHRDNYGQSYNDCNLCWGTGITGGYDGPYNVIIAPPETEKQIELADMGLHIRYDWATWMGPFPLINERDVIVRQNNERYVVGPVNPQGSRGAIYQQHFTMSYIDQGDIRYFVPITGGETNVPAAYDPYRQTAPTDASPAVNDKPEIPADKIIRGKTVTFENITY
jgi:hypothetical protein